jgi:hypothetical protein
LLALAAAFLAAPGGVRPAPPAAGVPALTEEEKEECSGEIRMVENRRRLFTAQGLSEPEQRRRNVQAEAALTDCVRAYRERKRRDAVEPPGARHAAGPEDVERQGRERRAKLDAARARDPRYMRPALSGLVCQLSDARERALAGIDEESRFEKLGSEPDRQRLYRLQGDVRRAETALANARRDVVAFGGPMRCGEGVVPVLAHCIAAASGDEARDSGCGAEEVQQYLRLLK